MVDRLLREHQAIRALASRFAALLVRPAPTDIEQVAACRWDMTRAILQHVAYEDRHAFTRLERDRRPDVAAIAQRFKQELETIQSSFEGHMSRWSSDTVLADWAGYRRVALDRNRVLLDRMRREEAEMFPLIAGNAEIAGGAPPPPPQRNWARAAWGVQDSLKRR